MLVGIQIIFGAYSGAPIEIMYLTVPGDLFEQFVTELTALYHNIMDVTETNIELLESTNTAKYIQITGWVQTTTALGPIVLTSTPMATVQVYQDGIPVPISRLEVIKWLRE